MFRFLGRAAVVVVLGIAVLFVAARFSDGPLAMIAGGPFTSGEVMSGPEPDWSFVSSIQVVEFQLVDPPRSRTTWILEHDGKAYIPCGYMTSWWGRIWKRWPIEVEKDDRAILRIDDTLFERRLVRIQDGPMLEPLLAQLSEKYLGGNELPVDAVTSGALWLFELAPRRS